MLTMYITVFLSVLVLFICETSSRCPPPCTCRKDDRYGGQKVDCSNGGLASIPQDLPTDTTTLLMVGNHMASLDKSTFVKLTRLRILNLSSNNISNIEEYAFKPLSNLVVLNLTFNHLLLNEKIYEPNLFVGLTSLKVLHIEDNDHPFSGSTEYPDKTFRLLTALTELGIDGLQADFGPGFSEMKNLTFLSLTSGQNYCRMRLLKNTTFSNVPSLQRLDMSHCSLEESQLSVFSHLRQLKTIDMSYNRKFGFDGLTNASYGLQNSSIESLNVSYVYPENDVCTRLKKEHVKYLNETNLRELYLDGNGMIGVPAMQDLPQTLERVSARNNKFQYGSYMMATLLLTSLKFVDVSGINKNKALPFLKRHAGRPVSSRLYRDEPVPVPPNLETLVASDCSFAGKITPGALAKNNLKTIIVSKNFFSALHGPIGGLEKIEVLDLSSNILEEINKEYFTANNSIRHLKLENNFLGDDIAGDVNGDIFGHLHKAKVVNLSTNRLTFLPHAVFRGLTSVEKIDVSDNNLESFDVDMAGSRFLSQLILTGNKIQMLSPNAQNTLTRVKQIHLGNNPFVCSCDTLNFLHWLLEHRKQIPDFAALKCSVGNRETNFTRLKTIIEDLEKECDTSNLVITLSISLSIVLVVIAISAGLCYRHRWKLRYIYHVGRRAYRARQQVDIGDDETYFYDAFVSYASPDRRFVVNSMRQKLEEEAGMRLCIHDRDFLPGDVIATSIVGAIQNSRKTLILMSPSFMESTWCEFEYQMARLESVTRKQNILIVVMLEEVSMNQLPKDLAHMLKSNSYLAVNDDEFGSVVFWENLAEAIRLTVTPE